MSHFFVFNRAKLVILWLKSKDSIATFLSLRHTFLGL